ncbi:MAG: hypothetical protein HY785_22145 [Oscillatoriophycideae cyanobacterium NC_groundwater_1537_Pr4_S-0.65um_50_18]|nr:hypothetical protein [Candidatus Woesearchaeota archaeon]MBI4783995.1 hypothetical protein [Oscillatoriophycideae cyanobacterium NC_groundwater_1537_Pr4_S-0.65um_50_18]
MNRFSRTKEIVNIKGFDLVKLGSLQLRERSKLMTIKAKVLDKTSQYLDLANKIAAELSITSTEAWKLFTEGLNSFEPEQQARVAPYLVEMQQKDSGTEYIYEAVVVILVSRLDSLKEISSELTEAFGIELDKALVTKFDKVPFCDRLQSKERDLICRQIVDSLPVDIYEALLDFAVGEESQWSTSPAEQEEVSDDPKS